MSEITIKEFTVQQVIDAIEKDGLEHLRGKWFVYTFDNKLTGACVLGQGAANLGVITESDDLEAIGWDTDLNLPLYDDFDVRSFGNKAPILAEQLNRFKISEENKWYTGGNLGAAGNTIIEWNDKHIGYHSREYVLPTYEDVVEMVKEVLAGYENEIVYLATRDYTFAPKIEVPANA